jgi:hypothetical protein
MPKLSSPGNPRAGASGLACPMPSRLSITLVWRLTTSLRTLSRAFRPARSRPWAPAFFFFVGAATCDFFAGAALRGAVFFAAAALPAGAAFFFTLTVSSRRVAMRGSRGR